MLLPLLLIAFTAPMPIGQRGTPPAVIEDARALEKALKSSDPETRLEALQATAGTSDARSVTLVVNALRDKDRGVRAAAIESLRFSTHAKALDGLHAFAKSKAKLKDDPESLAALLKAIGQHGNVKSLPILTSELLVQRDRGVLEAGTLSIANIRTKESIEELIGLMRSAGRGYVQRYMTNLRLALVVLTGTDQGLSQDAWNTWWNDHKRTFKVAPSLPALAPTDRRVWDRHWGLQRLRQRQPRRHERGSGDPE